MSFVFIVLGRHMSLLGKQSYYYLLFVVDENFIFNSDVSSMNIKSLLFCNSYPQYMPVIVRPN